MLYTSEPVHGLLERKEYPDSDQTVNLIAKKSLVYIIPLSRSITKFTTHLSIISTILHAFNKQTSQYICTKLYYSVDELHIVNRDQLILLVFVEWNGVIPSLKSNNDYKRITLQGCPQVTQQIKWITSSRNYLEIFFHLI